MDASTWVEIGLGIFALIVTPILGIFWNRLERLTRDFSDYREKVAETFATHKALDATENRIIRELSEVKELLHLLIQGQPEWPSRPSKPSS